VCWFALTLSRSRSKVKVIGQRSRSRDQSVAKAVGATSSEGYLVVEASVAGANNLPETGAPVRCFTICMPYLALIDDRPHPISGALAPQNGITSRFYSAPQCIASAVLATAIPSVCPYVCLSVTRRYCVTTTERITVQFALSDSKMCLVCKNQKIFPREDLFPLKSWLNLTYPLLIAASLDGKS